MREEFHPYETLRALTMQDSITESKTIMKKKGIKNKTPSLI